MMATGSALLTSRSTVAVIDANPVHRDQMAKALMSFYRVTDFPDVETAIGMMRHPPSVVIVDEKVRPRQAKELVRSLKGEVVMQGVPIIVCRARERGIDSLGPQADTAPDALLEKPFRRSELINTISGLLNQKVESGWSDLPPRPQKSLRDTLKTFNRFADLIERGEPIESHKLNATCAPLIEAVAHTEHKHILKAVRGHDNYSYVHSMRVATLLTLFGHTIGLKDDALVILASGGLVHDIGKMSIPHEVLNKPGALTDAEWVVMRSHVHRTIDYLKNQTDIPKGVITIAAQHHEKLDGTGYPHGLKGAQLNDLARMAAIVDVFTAMTDRRPYKAPVTPEKALEVMTAEMATALDTRLLKMFREMLLDAVAVDWV